MSIVSVYSVFAPNCLKTIGFIAFSLQQVAFLVRILVRKCIKRKKCKKALVFIVKIVTVIVFEDYFFKNLQRERFFKTAFAIGGRLTMMLLHALCVFLCIPLFEPK